MAWTSRMWRPQNSAICSNVSDELSTSQAAVAWGIRGWATGVSVRNEMGRPSRSGQRARDVVLRRTVGNPCSSFHWDVPRLGHDALHPLDYVRIKREIKVRLVGDVRISEQANV